MKPNISARKVHPHPACAAEAASARRRPGPLPRGEGERWGHCFSPFIRLRDATSGFLSLALALVGMVLSGRADVLIGTNGERFAGKVVEETPVSVVFDSELAGRLTIPRTRIRDLQRTPSPVTDDRLLITNAPPTPQTLNPSPRQNVVAAGEPSPPPAP